MNTKREEFLKVRQTKRGQKFLYLPKDTEFETSQWVMVVDPMYKIANIPKEETK